jgi:hypothetical protein
VTLRLLADENVSASLIRRLRELEEVEVASVAENAPGIDDVEVLRRGVVVVITADHDRRQAVQ